MALSKLATQAKEKDRKGIMHYLVRDRLLYLMLILPLSYFVLFHYFPIYGVTIAFKDYNIFKGVYASEWVGFDVFKKIFKMTDFYRALRNTMMLNGLDLLVGFPAPIILALVLNEIGKEKFKKITQTVIYLPHFLSWIIIGGIIYQLLSPHSGLINLFIKFLGMEMIPFLTDKWHWLFTYVAVGVWQNAGWGTIIYLAALSGIDTHLYEAADMDGAGRLKKIWHITLPGMKPVIIILLILEIGKMMSIGFERPYVMGNVLVLDFSDVISTFVYRVGLQSAKFSIATAVGLFQSVVGIILLMIANYATEKSGERGIW